MPAPPNRKRRPWQGGADPKLAGKRTVTRYQTSAPAATERAIYIDAEPFGAGFDVKILPPLEDGCSFDREWPTHKGARGYAGGLRLTLGLPIMDLTGEAS